MKLSEAFTEFMRVEILGQNKSPNTYEQYKYARKSIVGYLDSRGVRRLSRITPNQIADYYLVQTRQARNRLDPDTARDYIMCLHAVLKYCNRKGYKTIDADEIKVPKRLKKEVKYLTKNEIEEFIEEVGRPSRGYSRVNRSRNTLMVKMLFVTGIRVGELCALNRDSIKNGEFYVIGKSKDCRPCFINSEIENMIAEYLSMRSDNNPALFVSDQTGGRRISPKTVQMVFRNACRRSRFKNVHPHTMRHSYATYMINNGVGVLDLSLLLGHQSVETTKKYTHIANPRLREIHKMVMG